MGQELERHAHDLKKTIRKLRSHGMLDHDVLFNVTTTTDGDDVKHGFDDLRKDMEMDQGYVRQQTVKFEFVPILRNEMEKLCGLSPPPAGAPNVSSIASQAPEA